MSGGAPHTGTPELISLRSSLSPSSLLPRKGAAQPAFFRFREVGGRTLITNLEGRFHLLSRAEFERFLKGELEEGSALFETLREKNFFKQSYDEGAAVAALRARKRFLDYGPNLHVMVVTLRCNETCVYCHASRADMDAVDTDMSKETADRALDLIFQTTSPSITIEFQGGEPLVSFGVMKHIIESAEARNEQIGKVLEFTLVTNLSLMDEEKLAYLLDHRVQICTSVDGPKDLHDKQRKLPMASAYDQSATWIRRINEAYKERGLDPSLYHVEALLTTTKATLPRWKEVVDTYAELGCGALFLRPIDPFGFAEKTKRVVEYPRAEYLDFYRKATDYILELNKQGVQMVERYAAIFLTKILRGEDPNFLDIRSPAGAGVGQLAYSYDGRVYTCDEGRMLGATGDQSFCIGDVATSSYRDIVGHPTVRAMVIASNLMGQPDCHCCTYQPYCGIQTTHNYKTQGSIFGRMRESAICAVHKGIQDYLFEKLGEGDEETLRIFERWTTNRPREHFLRRPE